MKIQYSTFKNTGKIDNYPLTEKPVFSFNYEFLLVNSEVAIYAPKERANYPDLVDIPEEVMVAEYVNRDLTSEQLAEVQVFYDTWTPPVTPEPTAEELFTQAKSNKLNELKTKRDEIIFSPYNNVQVDTARSREDVQGAVTMWEALGNPASINWTMADNTEQPMTKADLEAVIAGYAQRKFATFAQYQQLKAQVESATTMEELEVIQW